MSDYMVSAPEPRARRSRSSATRTINNNIRPKGNNPRRRFRGNRIKSVHFDLDVEMTGPPMKETDKDDTPRLTPESEEKVTRVKPEKQYSREQLIELMTHPLSILKHPCLESSHNKSLVSGRTGARWLEDRLDQRKHSDSLTDEDKSDGSLDPQKKKANDPKAERLRKDQEVVLSPQRRSFNSGCFVTLAPQQGNSASRRPESPLKGERETSHREIPARRIGSGRIRDPLWDFRNMEKEEVTNQNSNHDYNNYRQRDDRFERRNYERSHEKERPQQRNSRYGNSNNDRKKYDKTEPEEPEWFSGGPTSQHDTIELHGFDGPIDEKSPASKKPNKNKSNSKNNRKVSDTINKNDGSSIKKILSRKSSPEVSEQQRLPSSSPVEEKKQPEILEPVKPSSGAPGRPSDPNCMFDFEDILNFDSLTPLLNISNGCVDEGSGSRFSQFFRRESPSPQQTLTQESRHSSTHDEMFNSMINDITSTNISIPPDGDTYFAPISPAASTMKEDHNKGPSANLLEMLQRGSQGFQGRKITKKPSLRDLEACGKIHSVEELEARLRQEQGIGNPVEYTTRPTNKEEELAVFRKLMMSKQAQNMQEQKSPHPNMSSSFQNQQQQQHGMNQQQQQQQQVPIPHDLLMKLLHVQQQQQQRQQEVFAKLLAPPAPRLPPTSQLTVPPPLPPLSPELQMHINNAQPTKELLQRPEAQTILISLKRGEISILHLVDQLKRNTTMQPIHREILASIIKLHGMPSGVGGTQREPSPATLPAPSTAEQLLHQMLHTQQNQHHQQQLRIPSPHANVLQRVPSPRELVAHTQNILQNALLKKKLEEQKENFRKRQEMQRSHSPNVSTGGQGSLSPANQHPNTTSPTPLAFTPTSVLRKMTADKDSELSNKQQQQSQQPEISQQPAKQGRAIVKGNNNFTVPPPVHVPPCPPDYMSTMPPQFKNVQRNKLPQTGGNPQQHYIMAVNRNNMQPPSSRARNMGGSNMVPQQQQNMTQSLQQLLMNHNYNPQQRNLLKATECQPMIRGQNQMPLGGRNFNMGYNQENSQEMSASPVSNQLARWFSPELLAQAREGKLPHMPPISPTQNMLSVEELERLQQAVHN